MPMTGAPTVGLATLQRAAKSRERRHSPASPTDSMNVTELDER
jgi:hypothetical protein